MNHFLRMLLELDGLFILHACSRYLCIYTHTHNFNQRILSMPIVLYNDNILLQQFILKFIIQSCINFMCDLYSFFEKDYN